MELLHQQELRKVKDQQRLDGWLRQYRKFEYEVKGIKKVCKIHKRGAIKGFALYNMKSGV